MKKKLENFFYYYKFHMLAVIFVIIVIIALNASKSGTEISFVVADSTSQMNIEAGKLLVEEFRKQTDLNEDEVAFRYRSMYLEEQSDVSIVDFEVAGIEDYDDCFSDGSIDFGITTTDTLWQVAPSEDETKEEETSLEYGGSANVIFLDDFFSKEELEKYEEYIYYVNGAPVGLVFDKLPKADKYFGDDYPSDNHYILQIAKGADSYTKEFLEFLISE